MLMLQKKEYGLAEQLLYKALMVMKANNHSASYKCLEYLGDIYFDKAHKANVRKTSSEQIKKNKYRSKIYFQKALTVMYDHLPHESKHIVRIKEKIKKTIEL